MENYGYIITLELEENNIKVAISKLETKNLELDEMYKRVDCSIVDIRDVSNGYSKLLGFDACLVFDEEFLLTNAPIINKPASLLFGYKTIHEDVLCGNVIIAKNVYNDEDEVMTGGLSQEEVLKTVTLLMSMDKIINDLQFGKQAPMFKIFGL